LAAAGNAPKNERFRAMPMPVNLVKVTSAAASGSLQLGATAWMEPTSCCECKRRQYPKANPSSYSTQVAVI
jgi:hypothetical protein